MASGDVTDARRDVTDARRDVTDANGDVIDARQELQISNNEEGKVMQKHVEKV